MKKVMIFAATILAGLVMYSINPLPVYSSVCSPGVTPSTASVPFSDTTVGDSSVSTTVTITNTSDCSQSLTSLSVSLTGDFGEFSIGTNTCTGTLSNPGSCQVDITFKPTAAVSSSAALTLTTGEGTFTDIVALTGTGIGTSGSNNTALLVAAAKQSQDDSDGCSATAATGEAGKKAYGPAALGLVAMLGLVMATAAIRRRSRRRD